MSARKSNVPVEFDAQDTTPIYTAMNDRLIALRAEGSTLSVPGWFYSVMDAMRTLGWTVVPPRGGPTPGGVDVKEAVRQGLEDRLREVILARCRRTATGRGGGRNQAARTEDRP